ncbi:MAG: hypothetical protein G01um101444_278 [Parcubacteria group bacterium Gr01-1014_44]|nr:MAG: hypothetical protein G01um101444_278 [Parcubacteria group bacterium Gr01-1014_44]
MITDSFLKEGRRVRLTILYTNREVVGTVAKVDSIFFASGSGLIFPYVTLNVDGKSTMVPLASIGSVEGVA